jgi:hypothetical protein
VTILCDKTKGDYFPHNTLRQPEKSALLFFLTPESHGNWSQKKSSNFGLQEKKQSRFFFSRHTLHRPGKKISFGFVAQNGHTLCEHTHLDPRLVPIRKVVN